MKKRFLASALALVVALSLLPINVLAAEDTKVYNDANSAKKETGVTAKKEPSGPDSKGNYTITLSVEGTTEDHTEQNDLPADVVLVVDSSYSMLYCTKHEHRSECYTRCNLETNPSHYDNEGRHRRNTTNPECKWIDTGSRNRYYAYPTCGQADHKHFYSYNGTGCGTEEGAVSRLSLAKDAATSFVGGLLTTDSKIKVGFADFHGESKVKIGLTDASNKENLTNAISGLTVGPYTNYTVGLEAAEEILKGSSEDRQKFIVFISDGEPNGGDGKRVADRLKRNGVTIMTVGIDLADSQAQHLKNISSKDDEGNALYYGAAATALDDVLDMLRKTITSKIHAGTHAVMTDVINTDKFDLVTVDDGLTNEDGTLTWDIGDIGKDKQSVSFKVRLKDDNTEAGEIFTNTDVNLTFKSSKLDGADVKFTESAIGKPFVKIYSVTYTDGAEGSVFKDQTTYNLKKDDVTPEFNGTLLREGYTFAGWDPEPVAKVSGDVYAIVYTAQWNKNSYDVKYYGNTDDSTLSGVPDDQKKDHDVALTLSAQTPTRTGYHFTKWNTESDGSGTDYEKGASYTENASLDLYAQWEINKYTVTYAKGDHGTLAGADTSGNVVHSDCEYDSATPEAPTVTADPGYYFTGWDKTIADKVTGDVTYTAQYAQVKTITLTGASDEKTYNGKEQSLGNDYTTTGLPDGYRVEGVSYTGAKGTNVDSYTGSFSGTATIKDADGHDVTNQFTVATVPGTLTITPAPVTVTAEDKEKMYGEADPKLTATVKGTFDSSDKITYTISRAAGNDAGDYTITPVGDTAQGNYEVTYVSGTLTIKPIGDEITVTITGKTNGTVYDGTEKTVNGYDVVSITKNGQAYDLYKEADFGLKDGVKAEANGTDADNYPMGLKGSNAGEDCSFENKSCNFTNIEFIVTDGKLTIAKRPVKFTGESASKEYTGSVLEITGITAEAENGNRGLLTGSEWSGLTYIASGTRASDAGYDGTFSGTLVIKDARGKDVTANYAPEYVSGKLTITKGDPTPSTFDFDNIDGKKTPAITKTVKGNVGKNFEETFIVRVKPESENAGATMADTYYAGEADVTYKNVKDVPFLFKSEVAVNASIPYGQLRFTKEGTYIYTVQEVKGGTGRMSYDTTKYFLTIEVELNEKENVLEVTSWQFTANKEAGTPLNIVNTYRAYQPSTPGVTKPALNTDDHYAYVMGYPDGTVQPGGYITRAEASTIFFRLLTDATREEYWAVSNEYTDVKDGDWYNNAISTLSNAGIVSGYPDGTFRPNAPITRAEMSKIIALFAKLDKTNDRFTDIAGHWAEAYIRLAAGNGWIEGYPDGSFRPNQSITRAETVTMINRVLERVPSEEDHLLSERVMLTFPDCKSGQWFYIAIQEATNSHTYERAVTEKNGDEQWIALRDNRDWTKLEY